MCDILGKDFDGDTNYLNGSINRPLVFNAKFLSKFWKTEKSALSRISKVKKSFPGSLLELCLMDREEFINCIPNEKIGNLCDFSRFILSSNMKLKREEIEYLNKIDYYSSNKDSISSTNARQSSMQISKPASEQTLEQSCAISDVI